MSSRQRANEQTSDEMKTLALGPIVSRHDYLLIKEVAATLMADYIHLEGWFKAYASHQAPRLAQELDLISSRLRPEDTLLDVGCIPPLFTLALRRRGYRIVAADLKPDRFESTLRAANIPYVRCDVETETLPFDDASFDAVLFNEIFEHLRINIPCTLAELRRVLRPGGLLFLSTPNLLALSNWLRLARTGEFGPSIAIEYAKLDTIGHMGHVRLYTPREVISVLKAVGFVPDTLVFRHPLPPSERHLRTGLKRAANLLVVRAVPRLSRLFSLICRRPSPPARGPGHGGDR